MNSIPQHTGFPPKLSENARLFANPTKMMHFMPMFLLDKTSAHLQIFQLSCFLPRDEMSLPFFKLHSRFQSYIPQKHKCTVAI
ncbi:hypothetical protein CEXT_584701 [Caerostris extrusa]|uniref:Uncharacterized protein n=1 Tax=Caerostris extrusa TaxID=172846 RepID=A0AAV4P2F6_CAEEX|nr:hypothetical protein CEXT_584701 [Caerostris extrusa]